jgi:hypothetical protein
LDYSVDTWRVPGRTGSQTTFAEVRTILAEALRIPTRGGMGLHLADCHLESGRLQLAQGNRDKAREHWQTAKAMIERIGYHRRTGK